MAKVILSLLISMLQPNQELSQLDILVAEADHEITLSRTASPVQRSPSTTLTSSWQWHRLLENGD